MRRILIAAMVLLLVSGGALAAKQNLRGDVSLLTTDVTTGDEGEVIAALNGLQADVDTLEAGTIAALVTEDINCTDDALISGDLTVEGSASIGGGYIASGVVQDDLEMAANKSLSCAAGSSGLDFSSGTGATKTTTGAVSLNGDTTVATAKTLAVTDADALTVGEVIVPQEIVIVWPINANSVDENIFIASDNWTITHIEEVHAVAGSHGDPVTLEVNVCDGTETPANGDAAQTATFNLKGTANTVQAATLTEDITLADGDRIGLDYTGDLTALAGGVVTVHLARA